MLQVYYYFFFYFSFLLVFILFIFFLFSDPPQKFKLLNIVVPEGGKKLTPPPLPPQKNYPNNPKKKPMHYCSYREQKKLPFRVPLMITRMLTKRTIRMRAAMEVRFNSQTLFTLKWRRLRRIKCGIGRFHVDFLVAETFMN